MEALAERVNDYFGIVLMLVVATYVLASLLPDRGWSAVVISATATTTAIFAASASGSKPVWIRRAVLISILAVGLNVIAAITDEEAFQSVAALLTVMLLGVALAKVLATVVMAPRINIRSILGALSVYTGLGLLFAFLFGTINRMQSEVFFEGVPHPDGSDFIFFSYTTLTTVGYGNLVPAGQPGQMFSGLEMLTGQIFLVVLVAGLVSGWRPGQDRRRRDSPDLADDV